MSRWRGALHPRRTQRVSKHLLLILFLFLCGFLASVPTSLAAPQETQTATPVEDSPALPKPPPGTLGTTDYPPTKKESPFYAKLAPKERRTGSMFDDYNILGKKGTFVGWLGIVRKI